MPHTPNKVKKSHQRPRNNANNEVNIQVNNFGDINQYLNIDINNPQFFNGNVGLNLGIGRPGIGQSAIAPRQANLGNARNRHRRAH